jgi:hypothetical protein
MLRKTIQNGRALLDSENLANTPQFLKVLYGQGYYTDPYTKDDYLAELSILPSYKFAEYIRRGDQILSRFKSDYLGLLNNEYCCSMHYCILDNEGICAECESIEQEVFYERMYDV